MQPPPVVAVRSLLLSSSTNQYPEDTETEKQQPTKAIDGSRRHRPPQHRRAAAHHHSDGLHPQNFRNSGTLLLRSWKMAVASLAVLSFLLGMNLSCSRINDTMIQVNTESAALSNLPEAISRAKQQTASMVTLTTARGTIQFLHPRPPRGTTAAYNQTWFKEAYSGMWWQKSRQFIDTDWELGFSTMPITASFKALKNGRARQTSDWLDLSVEHLSIFWKLRY